MRGWLGVGLAAGAVEAWALRRNPDLTLSRICGRHPWRTAAVAAVFLCHTNSNRIKWRKH